MTHTPVVSKAGCGVSDDNAATRFTHFQSPASPSSRGKVNPYGHLYSLATACPTTHRTRVWEDVSPPWTPQSSSRSLPYLSAAPPRVTHVTRAQLLPPMTTSVPTPLAARSLYMSPRSRSPLAPENAQQATYADTGCVYQHRATGQVPLIKTAGLSPINALTSVTPTENTLFPTQTHIVHQPQIVTRQRSSLGAVYSNYSGRGGQSDSEICSPLKMPSTEWRVSSPDGYISSEQFDVLTNAMTTPRGLKSKYLSEHPEAMIVPAAASTVVKCPFRSLRVAIDDIEWSPSETGAVYALEMSHGCESGCVTLRPHNPHENVCNAQMALSPESNLRFEVRDFAGRSLGHCDVDIAKMIIESTSALTGHLPIGDSLESPRLRVRSSIELSLLQAPEHPPTEAASTDVVSECGDTAGDTNVLLKIGSCLPEGALADEVEKATLYVDDKEVAELTDISKPIEVPCTESSKFLTVELFSSCEHLGNAVLHLYQTLHSKGPCEEIINVFSSSGDEVPIRINFKADVIRRQFDTVPEVLEEVDEENETSSAEEDDDHPTTLEGDENELKVDEQTEASLDPNLRSRMGIVLEDIETYPAKVAMRRVLSEVETARAKLSYKRIRSEIVQVPAKRAMKAVLEEIPKAKSKKEMRSVLSEIPLAKAKMAMKPVLADIPVARTKRNMKSLIDDIPKAKTLLQMKELRAEIHRVPFRKAMTCVCDQLKSSVAHFKTTDCVDSSTHLADLEEVDLDESIGPSALQRAKTMPVCPPVSAESLEGTESLKTEGSEQIGDIKTREANIEAITESLITSIRAAKPPESETSSAGPAVIADDPLDASTALADSLKKIITNVQEQINTRNLSNADDEEVRRANKRRRMRKRKSGKSIGASPTGGEWVIKITDENDRKRCVGSGTK